MGEILANKEVRAELDISAYSATKFLKLYGKKVGCKTCISKQRLRQLQLDGTVAEFKEKLK